MGNSTFKDERMGGSKCIRGYVFHLVYWFNKGIVAVKNLFRRHRRMKLDEQASMILLGAIKEMINNRNYCYAASNPKYSELRDPGKEFVLNTVEAILPMLITAKRLQDKENAEELMMEKLKT
jgi:hypothetical protein